MSKYEKFHPTLKKLLEKLADPKYSVSDARAERVAWCYAGCPVEPENTKTVPMCPECHGPNFITTLIGYLGEVDRNRATCQDCGWRGRCFERVNG